MKIGAVFPTTEIGNDPVVIRDWAQAAEALGYSHVVIYDHVLGAPHAGRKPKLMGPYTENDAFHEPFVLLSYLAAVTTRLELSTGVLILPQRQTALVAKQAIEVDILSQGRFRLGVGTGWNWVEYESLGANFDIRGKLLDEQVEVLRRLFRERLVDYTGEHHRIDNAGLLPQPTRDIPIWFGGFTEVAIKRAARLGDGFVFGAGCSSMRPLLGLLHQRLEVEGRDPREFDAEGVIDFSADRDDWSKELEVWHEAGGTHVCMRTMDTAAEFVGAKRVGFEGPQAYINALETFKKTLG